MVLSTQPWSLPEGSASPEGPSPREKQERPEEILLASCQPTPQAGGPRLSFLQQNKS